LHDVAQDVVISDDDCGTIRGVEMRALKDGEDVKEPLKERILGRTSLMDVVDPITNEVYCTKGQVIDEDISETIERSPIEAVMIRSVLTCESRRGVCARCYGRNMATGQLVDTGEAVGTIASQSIGEPGTQLTLRTFHTGGTASLSMSQSLVLAKFDGAIQFDGVRTVTYPGETEDVIVVVSRAGVINIVEPGSNRVVTKYDVVYGAELKVVDGQKVKKGDMLYDWDPYNSVIITEKAGRVRYRDLVSNLTFKEAIDEQTGHTTKIVIDSRDRTKSPAIEIVDEDGVLIQSYIIPSRAQIVVDDSDVVAVGSKLVKMPRDLGRLRDITGGLPRVTELFEARAPQAPSAVTEIDGIVSIDKPKRGSRVISVTSLDGEIKRDYSVPIGRHVLVQEGDLVRAGDRLTEGAINPHDILHIKGINEVQAYLVNEIQEVYRMQGVKINDKHIEVIVRQMLQKVRVTDAGDSGFLEGDQTDRMRFTDENDRLRGCVVVTDPGDSKLKLGQIIDKKVIREINVELKKKEKAATKSRNAEPAIGEPLLLGITQASLTTESWLSAASFQETTRVLADASAAAKVDKLLGLKENIILGQLVPAGTGLRSYQEMLVASDVGNIFGPDAIIPQVESEDEAQRRPVRRVTRVTA
jgi:DNA-directed RNA polymerase subunit beta'